MEKLHQELLLLETTLISIGKKKFFFRSLHTPKKLPTHKAHNRAEPGGSFGWASMKRKKGFRKNDFVKISRYTKSKKQKALDDEIW